MTVMVIDRRGVSPIVGVLLLVAITVVLAAVIGTFSFSLTQHAKAAPKAQFILNDAKDKINDDIFFRSQKAFDAILTISHVGGDPIKCQDIQIIVKDKTNGWSWVLKYDNRHLRQSITGTESRTYQFHAFYDPTKNGWSPVIFVFSSNQVEFLEQVGGPEYSVRNAGILQTGDTVILAEGNITIYGISGYGADVDNDGYTELFPYAYNDAGRFDFTDWLGDLFYTFASNSDLDGDASFRYYWKEIWNSTNTPADIEITIIHIPTKSVIYTGTVKVQ